MTDPVTVMRLFLKELFQHLLVYQFLVKALAQDLHLPEILLTKRKKIDAVCVFIDKVKADLGQLVKAVSFELSEKGTFLNSQKAVLFACLGHLAPTSVGANIVKYPSEYRHPKTP